MAHTCREVICRETTTLADDHTVIKAVKIAIIIILGKRETFDL